MSSIDLFQNFTFLKCYLSAIITIFYKKPTLFQRQKERKVYTDMDFDDEEIESKRNFNLDEKLNSERYDATFVKELKGEGQLLIVTIRECILIICTALTAA